MKKQVPGDDASGREMAPITLANDVAADINFTGYLVGERSEFDETRGVLTREAVYRADDGWVAYSVVQAEGGHRTRRAYYIEENKDGFRFISNGNVCFPVSEEFLKLFLLEALGAFADQESLAPDEMDEAVSG